jgi:patatin-like phospholipase/acyl hydrolase
MMGVPTYHVLALSGGGYRGLYTATVLAELEAVLGRPIASHFDLICGTSAGGMLALGWPRKSPPLNSKPCSNDRAPASLVAEVSLGAFWASG